MALSSSSGLDFLVPPSLWFPLTLFWSLRCNISILLHLQSGSYIAQGFVCLSMKAKFETESSPRGNLRDPPGEVSLASQFPLLPPPLLPSCFPPAPQLVSGSPQSPQPQSAVPPHLLFLLLLPHYTHLLLRFHCSTQLLPKTSDRDNHVIAICKEYLGEHPKSITGFFPKLRTPHSPFWKPLFRSLKNNFWALQKVWYFVTILTFTFGNRESPLPQIVSD